MKKLCLFGAKITLKDSPQLLDVHDYISQNQTFDPSYLLKRKSAPHHQQTLGLLRKLSEDKIATLSIHNIPKSINSTEKNEQEIAKIPNLKGIAFTKKIKISSSSKKGFNVSSLRFQDNKRKDATVPSKYELVKEFEVKNFDRKDFGSRLSKVEHTNDALINSRSGTAEYSLILNENSKSSSRSPGHLYKTKIKTINNKNMRKDESPGPGHYDPNLNAIYKSVNVSHHFPNAPFRELDFGVVNIENPVLNNYHIRRAFASIHDKKKKESIFLHSPSVVSFPESMRNIISSNELKNQSNSVNIILNLEKYDETGKIKRFHRKNSILIKNREFSPSYRNTKFKSNSHVSSNIIKSSSNSQI